MLAENEYAWQTIRKIKKKITIYRDVEFKTIQSPPYVYFSDIVKNSGCIYTTPNETSVITIQTLTTDGDGYTSRLTSDDSVRFGIHVVGNGLYYDFTIINVDLKNKKRYSILDGQGVKYVYDINFVYYLSNIRNYKDIRVFVLYIQQTKGINKGSETSVFLKYTQDIDDS